MAIKTISELAVGGGGGGGTNTQTTVVKSDTVANTQVNNETTTPTDGSSNFDKPISTNKLSSISQFKEAADLINKNRKEVKLQMDELTNNLYSSLNQMNFSIKLIVRTNDFLTKYTNNQSNLQNQLEIDLNADNKETSIDLYSNIIFNNLFVTSILYFENFSRQLMEAISNYLVINEGIIDPSTYDVKVKDIFDSYCEKFFIYNNWDILASAYASFSANYSSIFGIDVIDINRTESQLTLVEHYNQYVNVFDSLALIFDPDSRFTFDDVDTRPSISTNLIPSVRNIINFKSGSTLYSRYLDRVGLILDETIDVFTDIFDYAERLIKYNTEYQPSFKEDSTYISAIVDVCSIAIDLVSSLKLRYPNRNTRQGLIKDEVFTKLLNIINNLYTREIGSFSQLITLASRDYKLIKSLETFVTTDKSIDNSVLFKIMRNFDRDLVEHKLSSLIRLYFEETGDNVNVFGPYSFTKLLFDSSLLMDPFYDILSYYRLFLFPFSKDTSLVFDFLENLYIFNKSLTKQSISETINDLFDIKIDNIDFTNVNQSKVNESLTSRYQGLDQLNYFDIEPYMNAIESINLNTINNIAGLVTVFGELKAYDLIIFAITENILYGDLDLNLTMNTLSIKLNMRTMFFKIMFLIAIDKVLSLINTYYSDDVPTNLAIYTILNNNKSNILNIKEDISYLKQLILANKYYYGVSDVFNVDTIVDFGENSLTSIWDTEKIAQIKELFSLYKEV